MRFSTVVVALASAAVASAADIQVTVGEGGSLAYNPTSVTAAVGDTIHFEFRAKNHTVTQSTFASPCTIMTTPQQGIDSGFQFVAAGATQFPSWSFTINNASAPLWFYCRQKTPVSHCQTGMVFAVNPTAEKSFDAFQAAAKASASSTNSTTTAPPASVSTTAGSPTVTPAVSAGTVSTGAPSTTSPSGALRISGSAASILAVVGLVAGLVL